MPVGRPEMLYVQIRAVHEMVAGILMILLDFEGLDRSGRGAEFADGACEFDHLFDLQLCLHSLLRRRVVSS